jgi:hypothetical protein
MVFEIKTKISDILNESINIYLLRLLITFKIMREYKKDKAGYDEIYKYIELLVRIST